MKSIRRVRVEGSNSSVERLEETVRPEPPRPLDEALPEIEEWLKKLEEDDPENAGSYRLLREIFRVQAKIEREALERLRDKSEHLTKLARQVPRKRKPLLELAGGLPSELLDDAWLREKMLELLRSARNAGMNVESRAAPLEAPIEKGLISLSQMLLEIMIGRQDLINAWAGAVSAPRDTIKALVFWLLQPLVSAVKLASAGGIKWAQELWQQGVCPVCGAPASLGYQKGEGRHQFMRCRICGLEWRFPRARCPRCGADKPGSVVFYTPLPDKPWLRLYKCKECGWEWKIVDEEHKDAVQHGLPPHELYDVLTYPLDLVSELIRERRGNGRHE